MTHRQFNAWQAWLEAEWDKPSRDNWYQMATTTAVMRVLAKNPGQITVADRKLKFESQDKKASPEQRRQVEVAQSKARWVGGMGEGVTVVQVSREEMERINQLPAEEAVRARRALAGKR